MKQEFYLTLNNIGSVPKVTQKRPKVSQNQAALLVVIEIPDSYFFRPSLHAKIKIEDGNLPRKIESNVIIDAQRAIEAATGMHITLEVIQPQPPATLEG